MARDQQLLEKYLNKFTEFMDEGEREKYFPWFDSIAALNGFIINKAIIVDEDNPGLPDEDLVCMTVQKYGLSPFHTLNISRYDNGFIHSMITSIECDNHYKSNYIKYDEEKFYTMLTSLCEIRYEKAKKDAYSKETMNIFKEAIKENRRLAKEAKKKK